MINDALEHMAKPGSVTPAETLTGVRALGCASEPVDRQRVQEDSGGEPIVRSGDSSEEAIEGDVPNFDDLE